MKKEISLITLKRMKENDFFARVVEDCDETISHVLAICMYCNEIKADGFVLYANNSFSFVKACSNNKWKIIE
jgi:hypothetical protein